MRSHPAVTGSRADAAATLAVLVVGAALLAMTAPLVSAFAVLLTAVVYIPVRRPAIGRVRAASGRRSRVTG